jgi:SAM-dependent methyltransferase
MIEITWFRELYEKKKIVSNFSELGCAVGNTLFPLLREFPCFNYFGCDISAKAISLIEEEMEKHQEFKPRLKVAVCDLVKD